MQWKYLKRILNGRILELKCEFKINFLIATEFLSFLIILKFKNLVSNDHYYITNDYYIKILKYSRRFLSKVRQIYYLTIIICQSLFSKITQE